MRRLYRSKYVETLFLVLFYMFILIQIKRSPDEISREISHETNLILFNVRSHVRSHGRSHMKRTLYCLTWHLTLNLTLDLTGDLTLIIMTSSFHILITSDPKRTGKYYFRFSRGRKTNDPLIHALGMNQMVSDRTQRYNTNVFYDWTLMTNHPEYYCSLEPPHQWISTFAIPKKFYRGFSLLKVQEGHTVLIPSLPEIMKQNTEFPDILKKNLLSKCWILFYRSGSERTSIPFTWLHCLHRKH